MKRNEMKRFESKWNSKNGFRPNRTIPVIEKYFFFALSENFKQTKKKDRKNFGIFFAVGINHRHIMITVINIIRYKYVHRAAYVQAHTIYTLLGCLTACIYIRTAWKSVDSHFENDLAIHRNAKSHSHHHKCGKKAEKSKKNTKTSLKRYICRQTINNNELSLNGWLKKSKKKLDGHRKLFLCDFFVRKIIWINYLKILTHCIESTNIFCFSSPFSTSLRLHTREGESTLERTLATIIMEYECFPINITCSIGCFNWIAHYSI